MAVMRDNDKIHKIYYYWVATWNMICEARSSGQPERVFVDWQGIQYLAHGGFSRVTSSEHRGLDG